MRQGITKKEDPKMKGVPLIDEEKVLSQRERSELLHRAINSLDRELADDTMYKKNHLEIERLRIHNKSESYKRHIGTAQTNNKSSSIKLDASKFLRNEEKPPGFENKYPNTQRENINDKKSRNRGLNHYNTETLRV